MAKTATGKAWQGSKWITKTRRLAIYLRDEFTCQSCGRDLHGAKAAEVQLDHLVCRSKGGSNESTNLVTICRSCNSQRQVIRWTVFYGAENVKRINNLRRRKLNMDLARELTAAKAA